MSFQMKIDNSKLEGLDVMPAGLYKVRLLGFKPKYSKPKGDGSQPSLNLNAQMEVYDNANPELNGRKVFEGLNQNAGWVLQDFAHAFGFALDTDGISSWLPGAWDGDVTDAASLAYKGPMLGQIAEVELAVDSYNGKENNKVGRYICRVPDCATKFPTITHTLNLLKKG